jgi:hypothetical protein
MHHEAAHRRSDRGRPGWKDASWQDLLLPRLFPCCFYQSRLQAPEGTCAEGVRPADCRSRAPALVRHTGRRGTKAHRRIEIRRIHSRPVPDAHIAHSFCRRGLRRARPSTVRNPPTLLQTANCSSASCNPLEGGVCVVVSPQKSLTRGTVIPHLLRRCVGRPQTMTRRNNSCIVFRSDAAFAEMPCKAILSRLLAPAPVLEAPLVPATSKRA